MRVPATQWTYNRDTGELNSPGNRVWPPLSCWFEMRVQPTRNYVQLASARHKARRQKRLAQVWRSPTDVDRASSSERQEDGGTTGRTTNFEKPTRLKRSMSRRRAGSPTGVNSRARERRAVITRAVAGSMGARA